MKNYQRIAQSFRAYLNCIKSANHEWETTHLDNINKVMESAPSGSGFDNGTHFDESKSTADKLVFRTSFHHMNEDGYYDGWSEHTITIRPDWTGVKMTISGRDRGDIKDYIGETFDYWFDQESE